MPYQIDFTSSANKELVKLRKSIQPKQFKRIEDAVEALVADPHPPGVETVETTDYLRVRTGDYRIVYLVEEDVLTVLIIRIGHRREVYRRI
ncbi:MAG: type II toxin-antitoxin system RelE/ParE family toxin [Rubrobacteraceae bacterium]